MESKLRIFILIFWIEMNKMFKVTKINKELETDPNSSNSLVHNGDL